MFFNSRALLNDNAQVSSPANLANLATCQAETGELTRKVAEVAKVASNDDPVINVAEVLGRPLAYLTAPDDRLPGLCLFSRDDIQDIESGVLPLDNAKRYLEQMEQQYPHLQSGGDDSGDHPLLKAMDDLKHSGIELVPEDRRHIRDKIGHRMNWATFLDGYKREWLAAMDGCLPHQKQNRGRFAANTWLNGGAL